MGGQVDGTGGAKAIAVDVSGVNMYDTESEAERSEGNPFCLKRREV